MVSDATARLVVTADTTQVQRGLEQLRDAFARLDRSLPIGSFKALTGALSAVSFGAAVSEFRELVGRLDDLADAAQGVGVTASELSTLQLSARAAGVGADELGSALARLNVRIGEAAAGNREAVQLFSALGIAVRDSAGNVRGTADILADIADKFARLEDGASKSALATELFRQSGRKFIALLNEGREGLAKFGGVSAETIRQAQQLQEQIDRLSAAWERLKLTVAGTVAGGINRLFDSGAINASDQVLARLEKRIGSLRSQLQGRLNPEVRQAIELEVSELEQRVEAIRAQARRFLFSDEGYGARRESADAVLAQALSKQGQEAVARHLSDGARLIEQLQRQAQALRNVSDEERILEDLRDGRVRLTDREKEFVGVLLEQNIALRRQREELEAAARADLTRLAAQQEAELAADAEFERVKTQVLEATGRLDELRKRRQTEVLEYLITMGQVTQEEAERAVKAIAGITEQTERAGDAAEQFGLVFASSIGRFIEDGGRDLHGFFDALGQDLLKLTTQLLVVEPLARSLRDAFRGVSSGQDWGAVLAAFGSSIFGGARASGGWVGADRAYLVGERGPELFVPSRAGTIVPNDRLRGEAMRPTVVVNLPAGAPVTSATAQQVGAAAARAILQAHRRLN